LKEKKKNPKKLKSPGWEKEMISGTAAEKKRNRNQNNPKTQKRIGKEETLGAVRRQGKRDKFLDFLQKIKQGQKNERVLFPGKNQPVQKPLGEKPWKVN